MRRVVITGMGAVTPIGNDKDTFWENIKKGVSGVDLVTRFDATDYACKIGAEVKDFNPEEHLDRKEAKRMDRYTQFALASAKMAMQEAKLDMEKEDADRVGVIIGSGVGGFETLENQAKTLAEKGPGRVSQSLIEGGSGCYYGRCKGRELLYRVRLRIGYTRSRRGVSRDSFWGCGCHVHRWCRSGNYPAFLCRILLDEGTFYE